MITNSSLTVYHKGFDDVNNIETWTRFNYDRVWWHGGRGAGINKGYTDANDVDIRISYSENPNINNFSLGDILVKGNLDIDIRTQQDLEDYEVFNITSISDNTFGGRPHIHIGGR